jgi:hypothetical protein
VNDDKKEEDRESEGGNASSSYAIIDKREAPCDKSMEAQVNDPVITTSSPSSDSEGRARKGRIKLLEALNTLFIEAYNNMASHYANSDKAKAREILSLFRNGDITYDEFSSMKTKLVDSISCNDQQSLFNTVLEILSPIK